MDNIDKGELAKLKYMIAEGFVEPDGVAFDDGIPRPACELNPNAVHMLHQAILGFSKDYGLLYREEAWGWHLSKGGVSFHVPVFINRYLGGLIVAFNFDIETGKKKDGGIYYTTLVDMGSQETMTDPNTGKLMARTKMGFIARTFKDDADAINDHLKNDIQVLITYMKESGDENQKVRLAGHGEHDEEVRNPGKAGRRKKVVPSQRGTKTPDVRHGGGKKRGDAKTERPIRKKKGGGLI